MLQIQNNTQFMFEIIYWMKNRLICGINKNIICVRNYYLEKKSTYTQVQTVSLEYSTLLQKLFLDKNRSKIIYGTNRKHYTKHIRNYFKNRFGSLCNTAILF